MQFLPRLPAAAVRPGDYFDGHRVIMTAPTSRGVTIVLDPRTGGRTVRRSCLDFVPVHRAVPAPNPKGRAPCG